MTVIFSAELVERVARLYDDMEQAYDRVAGQLHFSCSGCPDNCCDSYFLHHTYLEWGYLWLGVNGLAAGKREEILSRAADYERLSEEALRRGQQPHLMCPLNEAGRCILYRHRLMVCRTHGVPASMTRPDGRSLRFPGCFRCQEMVAQTGREQPLIPVMERTDLLRRLVELELELLQGRRHLAPKVKMTIARMLLSGAPSLPRCGHRPVTP